METPGPDTVAGMDTPTADQFLNGRMLIATPAIGDPRFERSVIFVCAHTDEHAMGIIVNKALGALRLPELLDQLGVTMTAEPPDRPVLNGGPVDRDRGFVLHTDDYHMDDATVDVSPGVGLTATKDVLEAIAGANPPREAILALGYAGWGAGQLETEIQSNAWLICESDPELLFGTDLDEKWTAALGRLGISPEKLSGLHGRA